MGQIPIHHVQVRATYATCLYFYYDLPAPWCGQWPFAQNQRHARPIEHHGLHRLHRSYFFQLSTGHPKSNPMRTDIAQPIRLKDYRPPDWLVETVSLDFSLHPTATKVRATIAFKRNPKTTVASLVLEGCGLSLVSLKVDGAALPVDSYVA